MTAGPHVRDFSVNDVPEANALTNYFIEHTAIHFGTAPSTDPEFRALWERGRARFPWLVAELGGRFAGYCKAGVWRERAAYARTVETGIYVTSEVQGRGVGRALYLDLLARLRLEDFHRVVAGITLPNEASVRLHESVGFRPVGVFHEVGHKLGVWHDVGFWELALKNLSGICIGCDTEAR